MSLTYYWRCLGRIYDPDQHGVAPWMAEFAQCPTPLTLNGDIVRVYFATRPPRNRDGMYVARPGYVDLDRTDLTRIVGISAYPVLELGGAGTFDEFGVMPGSVIRRGDALYMYYTGWTRKLSVPYVTAIGVAVSHDNGSSFVRLGPGPVLNVSLNEPFLVNSPIVKFVDDVWHMWYVTGERWIEGDSGLEIVCRHAHAVSNDGLVWAHRETGIMPTILGEAECHDQLYPIAIDGQWHAFFAYRYATGFRSMPGRAYRLGHATSADLRTWRREDDGTRDLFARPDHGWDADAICSTQFLELDGRRWMFYCGNGIGRSGFGVAELTTMAPATL